MDEKTAELKEVQNQGGQYPDGGKLRRLEGEIDGLLHEKEQYLQQQARVLWLKEGGLSTHFFPCICICSAEKE